MSTRGTTAQQPSDSEPYQLRSDHVLLAAGVISLTVAVLLAILDNVAKADYIRGMYSILTGLFVVGIVGWQVRSGQARLRHMVESRTHIVEDRLAELTSQIEALAGAVEALAGEAGRAHVTYLPSAVKQCDGRRYVGSSAVGQADTMPLMPTVPPDVEAALRRINMRVLNGGDQE